MPPSKRIDNVLGSTLIACKLMKSASNNLPVTGLSNAFDVVCSIIEVVQNVRSLRDDCNVLAERTVRLAVSMMEEASKFEDDIPEHLILNMKSIHTTLEEIQTFLNKHVKMSWTKRFIRLSENKQQIKDLTLRLEECYRTFEVCNLIDLQAMVSKMHTLSQDVFRQIVKHQVVESEVAQERHGDIIQRLDGLAETFQVVKENQVVKCERPVPLRTIRTSTDVNGALTAVYSVKLQDGCQAVLKSYEGKESSLQKFKNELKIYNKLYHPNMPRILFHSAESSHDPFIVLRDFTCTDLRDFMEYKNTLGTVPSWIAGLALLQGVTSALEYLRVNQIFTQSELRSCTELQNVLLNADGQPVLGYNILYEGSPTASSEALTTTEIQAWLNHRLWEIASMILFGEWTDSRWSDWNSASGHSTISHLRCLLRCVGGGPKNSFSFKAQRLDSLFSKLIGYQSMTGTLPFTYIRQTLLKHEIPACHLFRPCYRLEAQLGDVGYMTKDQEFVKLFNAKDKISSTISTLPMSRIGCDGRWTEEDDGTGHTRYTFTDAHAASVRRESSGREFTDRINAWKYFLVAAPKIVEEYGKTHSITITDLILVTARSDDIRLAFWDQDKEDVEGAAFAQTVFVANHAAGPDDPWGEWQLSEGRDAKYFRTERYAHVFAFAQLEKEDCIS